MATTGVFLTETTGEHTGVFLMETTGLTISAGEEVGMATTVVTGVFLIETTGEHTGFTDFTIGMGVTL